jgi:DNA-binding transcriptional MerR regulator
MSTSGDRPIYGISAVARMLNLAASTIRNWEDRYGVVRPARSAGGQRLYSRRDLEQLGYLGNLVEQGTSPADAHRLLEERIAAGTTIDESADDPAEIVILLAERDPFAVDLAEFLLRTEGFLVVVAGTPDDALDAFATRTPALVIVELLLGGGRGVALCRELKRRGAACVIATSALQLGDDVLAAGADAFLPKPLDPLLLVSTVKDLLARSAITGSVARRP